MSSHSRRSSRPGKRRKPRPGEIRRADHFDGQSRHPPPKSGRRCHRRRERRRAVQEGEGQRSRVGPIRRFTHLLSSPVRLPRGSSGVFVPLCWSRNVSSGPCRTRCSHGTNGPKVLSAWNLVIRCPRMSRVVVADQDGLIISRSQVRVLQGPSSEERGAVTTCGCASSRQSST